MDRKYQNEISRFEKCYHSNNSGFFIKSKLVIQISPCGSGKTRYLIDNIIAQTINGHRNWSSRKYPRNVQHIVWCAPSQVTLHL